MVLPVTTAIVFIFILWMNYEMRKSSNAGKEATENYRKKEKHANPAPSKDINSLELITISLDFLPMGDKPEQAINSYRDSHHTLVGRKAVNLCDFTNTELTQLYGSAHLKVLTEMDNNYTLLVSNLQKWADALQRLGYDTNAVTVLEYALSCKTDVVQSYMLLAKLYRQSNQSEKMNHLLTTLNESKIRNKKKLITQLSLLIGY